VRIEVRPRAEHLAFDPDVGDVAFDRLQPHAARTDRLLRDDDLREHVAVVAVLARERGVSAIDLALVEDGIEIGKQMMAAMIATYSASSASPSTGAVAAPAAPPAAPAQSSGAARTVMVPAGNGSGYLNEVSPLTVRASSEYPEG
jgi:hypothetical protein